MNTPWGKADQQTRIDVMMYWISTPSHGGLGIASSEAVKLLSPEALEEAIFDGIMYWFEEDCAWCVAALELGESYWHHLFPSSFPYHPREYCEDMARRYFPGYAVKHELVSEGDRFFHCVKGNGRNDPPYRFIEPHDGEYRELDNGQWECSGCGVVLA